MLWSIRPERVVIAQDGQLRACVVDVADVGSATEVTLRLDGDVPLRARAVIEPQVEIGESCGLQLDPAALSVWPVDGAPSAGTS